MKRAVPPRHWVLIIAAFSVVMAGIAWGADPAPRARSQQVRTRAAKSIAHKKTARKATHVQKSVQIVSGQEGMRIFRDPETGEIGPPSAENLRRLAAESGSPQDLNLHQYPLPNGGWAADMDASQNLESVVMQIDKNGKRVVRCVKDEKAAHQHPVQAPVREDR